MIMGSGIVLGIMLAAAMAGTIVAISVAVAERRRNAVLTGVLNNAIDFSPGGFLFFDSTEKLARRNRVADRMMPALQQEESLCNLDGFLDFIYAHKIRGADSCRKADTESLLRAAEAAEISGSAVSLHDFQEVIGLEDRILLMQAKQFHSGETAVYLTDISEIKSKDAQLFQAQKLEALGQLAGGVAHDFNNVLSIIDGYTMMSQNNLPAGCEKVKNYLDRVRQASQRGASLTRQLLLFGRHKIASEGIVDVSRLLRDQERLLQPLLDAQVRLTIDAQQGLYVACMPDGLAQVVMNLVINARDAMPEGGNIAISARSIDGTRVELAVTDTGMGIDPKIVARIFDPFFTTKEQGKGTGLGLSMVYGLVKDMNGTIAVESEPGAGTSMRIVLPQSEKAPVKQVKASGEGVAGIRFEGYTALVAEDEPHLLEIVCSLLEQMGMEVIPASNGAEALMKQDEYEGDIDFLLTDVVMPELNGVKLAELLQAVREETKVIFMSGFPASGKLARIHIPEGAILLAKPVAFDSLAEIMRAVLDEGNLDGGQAGVEVWQTVQQTGEAA